MAGGFLSEYLGMIGGVTGLIIVIVLSLVLGTLFLKLGLKASNASNRGFGAVFVTNILDILVSYCCCIIAWFIIKSRHKISLGAAIGAWIIAALIPIAISIGIVFLLVTAGWIVAG